MLEFDRRGRLAGKHRCRQREGTGGAPGGRKRRPRPFDYAGDFNLSSITRKNLENLFREGYRCPACGVEFLTEESYRHHFKQKRNYDDEHHQLYQEYRALTSGAGSVAEVEGDGDIHISRATETKEDGIIHGTGNQPAPTPVPPPESIAGPRTRPGSIQSFGRVVIKTSNGERRLVFHSGDWYDEWKGNQEEKGEEKGEEEGGRGNKG